MSNSYDRGIAAAEAGLDRIDENGHGPAGHLTEEEVTAATGMHIEGADALLEEPTAVDDELADDHARDGADEVVDAFNEAFNARDLDTIYDLLAPDAELPGLGGDRENLADVLEEMWDRRPSVLLTRGVTTDGRCVAVLWEIGDDGTWWKVAPVFFDDIADSTIGLVELTDDADLLDDVETEGPGDEFEEGARWSEWEDGVTD